MRVLFVCLGNICRSPTAEAVAQSMMPNVTFDSAGTSGWHIGDPPYALMQAAASENGYDMSGLRAREFQAEDFESFDLILGMDRRNVADIESLRPDGNTTAVRLATEFVDDPGEAGRDVPDPYYTRDFKETLRLIEALARGLKAKLAAHPGA